MRRKNTFSLKDVKHLLPTTKKLLKTQNENQSKNAIQDSKPKHNKSTALERAVQREKESSQRIIIRITSFRVRPLDPDNLAGGTKNTIDGLRYAKLIPGDEPWKIKLEVDQKPVNTYKEEYTEIEIDYGKNS